MKIMSCVFMLSCSFLFSCATSPVEPSGFMDNTEKLEEGRFLQRVWKYEKLDLDQYDSIYIEPVSTILLRSMGWWDKMNATTYDDSGMKPGFRSRENTKSADMLGRYFDDCMTVAFKKSKTNRFRLVKESEVNEKTLVLEIRILELVPVKKYMFGLGLIGEGSLKGGTVAIEGQLRQGKSKRLLAMFTDRKINNHFPDYSDHTTISWYSHAKPEMRKWAKLFVSLANQKKK